MWLGTPWTVGWGGRSRRQPSSSLPSPGPSLESSWGIHRTVSLRGSASVLPASDVRARECLGDSLYFSWKGEEIETEWPQDGMGKPPGCRRPLIEGGD